jgi:hypothetical protein
MIDLNNDTVELYAIKAYDKYNYVKSEFEEDFKTFRYIKRLLQRYRATGDLRENLVLNHINLIYNLFGVEAGTRLLFYKMDKADYVTLKTFLIFLNLIPDVIQGIEGVDIRSSDIAVDIALANILRDL